MNARPYATQMQRVLTSVASRVDPSIHPLLSRRELGPDSKTLVILVSGDKGLATCAGGQLDVHGVGPVQTGGT